MGLVELQRNATQAPCDVCVCVHAALCALGRSMPASLSSYGSLWWGSPYKKADGAAGFSRNIYLGRLHGIDDKAVSGRPVGEG